eukprot:scaffold155211_cov22-Prasinocladus_malaysianus.AAC.1
MRGDMTHGMASHAPAPEQQRVLSPKKRMDSLDYIQLELDDGESSEDAQSWLYCSSEPDRNRHDNRTNSSEDIKAIRRQSAGISRVPHPPAQTKVIATKPSAIPR